MPIRFLRASPDQWRDWYDFLAGDEEWFIVPGLAAAGSDVRQWRFMNAGYLDMTLERDSDRGERFLDELDRLSINLYEHLLARVDAGGKDIVEVGSGRGGGCDHIARTKHARSVLGIDLSERAVAFSRKRYDVPTLAFRVGDALALPLDDASVDIVLNVESSHCYADFARFAREVHRVLRHDGTLLFTDFRPAEALDALRTDLSASGLTIVADEDITSHVVAALDRHWSDPLAHTVAGAFTSPLALERFQDVGRELSKSMAEPIGTEDFLIKKGSVLYRLLSSGDWVYLALALTKVRTR